MNYTPININKLLPRGREVLRTVEKLVKYYPNHKKIPISIEDYEQLLMTLDKSIHKFYQDAIPYKGKEIVRA